MKRRRSSTDGQGGSSNTSGKLVLPQVLVSDEIRENLDRILFEFLNRVCSDRGSLVLPCCRRPKKHC
jgi:hypothetical protein